MGLPGETPDQTQIPDNLSMDDIMKMMILKSLTGNSGKPGQNSSDLGGLFKQLRETSDPVGTRNRAASIPGFEFGPGGLFAGQTPDSRKAAMENHTGAYAPNMRDGGMYLKPQLDTSPAAGAQIADQYGEGMRLDNPTGPSFVGPVATNPLGGSAGAYNAAAAVGTSAKGLGALMKALMNHEAIKQMVEKRRKGHTSDYEAQ